MEKFNLKFISSIIFVSGTALGTTQEVDNVKVFQSLRKIVLSLNQALKNFLSRDDHNPMFVHVERFRLLQAQMNEVIVDLEAIIGNKKALKILLDHVKQIAAHFAVFVDIVDSFKYKSQSSATELAQKLNKAVDMKKVFLDTLAKLEVLAIQHKNEDKQFSEFLSAFIVTLKNLVSFWEKRNAGMVFKDICARMSRKEVVNS